MPEEVLLYPDGKYAVIALSNQVHHGQLPMTDDQLGQLHLRLAAIHEKFAELYGIEDSKPFAMEIEFKITSDNILSIKQARPWVFAGPPPAIDNTNAPAEVPGVALTASFEDVPASHDGNPFGVRIQFSEFVSFRDPRHAATVTGGRVTRVWRVDLRDDLWTMRITPDSPHAEVNLVLAHNRPCSVRSAICTYHGRRLSARLEHTVKGLLPAVPDRPTVEVLSSDIVDLEWNDVSGSDSYDVQFSHTDRWVDLPADGTEIAFDGAAAAVSGLPASDVYYFRVRSVNSNGVSAWSPRLFMPIRLDWESELTAGLETDVLPEWSGYSALGSLGGTLSPDSFEIDGTTYRVRHLVHASESLWLGMYGELPADFTLLIGDSDYRGSESMVPPSIEGEGYWWPSATPDWCGEDPVRVSLTVHPEVALGDRQKAPVTAYFRNHPSEHDGNEDFSFRIYFREGVATTADALRHHVLSVTGGTVSSVEAVGNEGRVWAVPVTPGSHDAVTVRIEANLDCGLSNAVCTADGRRLFNRMRLVVEPREKNPPTGAPTISGTLEAGETLTADTSGISDADGLTGATFSYQWVSHDGNANTDIQGATDSSHTLVPADEGRAFRVRVSFTDDAGNKHTLTSALLGSEQPYGLTAMASDGSVALSWKLPAGGPYSSTFQILRNRPELGETQPLVHVQYLQTTVNAHKDTDVEPGVLYVYRVKGVDPFGYTGEASHPYEIRIAAATPVANNPAFGTPTISGAARVGETLSADMSGIADVDGLTRAPFSYQWRRGSSDITGATGSTYTVASDDAGNELTVRVSFTDDDGFTETVTSPAASIRDDTASTRTATPPNSKPSGQPDVTGAAQVGQTLSASTSNISDPNGLDNAAFSYQWTRTGADMAGATGSTHTILYADASDSLLVRVSFEDDDGYAEQILSAALAVPEPDPLTASSDSDTVPGQHSGANAFTLELEFSSEPALSFANLREHVIDVANGDLTEVSRTTQGSNLGWQLTIEPDGDGDVIISLPATTGCDDQDAVCTRYGQTLAAGASVTVNGPAAEEQQQTPPPPDEPNTNPPPAPTGLSATLNPDGSITLTWTAPSDDPVTSYQGPAPPATGGRGLAHRLRGQHWRRRHHRHRHDGGHPSRLQGEGPQRQRPQQLVHLRQGGQGLTKTRNNSQEASG